ncbi:MAG: hypothetical protein IMZ67_00130 [Acidobacteria bacterium]|nr:hypothetical protein [Acidobacteriota bacterium]
MKNNVDRMVVAVGCVLMLALVATVALAQQKPMPSATAARVEVKASGKVIPLKREEQIAFMFVDAIKSMEDDCGRSAAEPCTLEALVRGPKAKDSFGVGKLKFDPNATDVNYTYKITLDGNNWEIWADPRKPGLGGFYNKGRFGGGTWYNPAGTATRSNMKIEESSIVGDLFRVEW